MGFWGLGERLRSTRRHLPQVAVERLRVPPRWLGYRSWMTESVEEYAARTTERGARYQLIHPETVHVNPLPRNIDSREDLPSTIGWWGFSFRDVPARRSSETFLATVPDCRIVQYVEDAPDHPFRGDYYVGIMGRDDRSLELREVRFRERHGAILRSDRPVERLARATWILERVYHNHSHWLTAHVPKLELLRSRGLLDDLILPRRSTPAIDASLRMLGLDRSEFRTVDAESVLEVEELTLIGSDRFRPELLRSVRGAMLPEAAGAPGRRIYVSRAKAARRRLLNEDEIWAILRPAGFERVFMEDLPFEDQVSLMAETAILVAPHGAGLTNMLFCRPGTQVVEIADLSFPNPNFYAMASALGHEYWLIQAEAVGDGHPLERDMLTNPPAFEEILAPVLTRG